MNIQDVFAPVFGEEKIPDVTIVMLESLAKELLELYTEEGRMATELKVKRLDMTEKEAKLQSLLEISNKDSYHSEIGTFSIVERKSVKTPKTPEDKLKLFEWLKEQNLYDEVVCVNSQTLNKIYKDALEASIKRGDEFFRIPGLGDPTVSPYISFRRKK